MCVFARGSASVVARKPCVSRGRLGAQNLVPTRSMAWLVLFDVEWIFMCSTGSAIIQREGPKFEAANHYDYRLHSLQFSRDDPIDYRSLYRCTSYANAFTK